MTDHRCKTCRHWERETEKWRIESLGSHAGTCNCSKFAFNTMDESDCLCYWDYDEYNAYFRTGEDFGCIHWEGGE